MPQPESAWIVYAIASGGCAALNGVFAKLTTTELTSRWAAGISRTTMGTETSSALVDFIIRGSFLALNLAFNAVMWGLFTRALTLASSTVRVSVINTSANFVLSALLGAVLFGEVLPAQWWLGAVLLIAGSVIIGRRDEGKVESPAVGPDGMGVDDRQTEGERRSAAEGSSSGVEVRNTNSRRRANG